MAQSRRPTADPADIYRAHAAEARAELARAATDTARTQFDHAAAAHDHAARVLARIPRLQRSLSAVKGAAAGARTGRNRNMAQADYYDSEVVRIERAIRACAPHAERHYLMGLERSAVGREHERNAPSTEDRVALAAERIVAGPDDTEFRTAAQHRAGAEAPPEEVLAPSTSRSKRDNITQAPE